MSRSVENISVEKCKGCGKLFMSPVYVCSACGSEEFEPEVIEGEGKIYTHTTIRIAPEAFMDQVPYHLAIVELPHNLRLTARIDLKEGEKMEIGRPVSCIRKDDVGYWFELR
nr:hypothetical protein [Desulfobacterales bacterium]